MKSFILIGLIVLAQFSCKKTIEKIQQDLVVQAMVDGQWAVTSFTQNGTDITNQFNGYKFKYYENKTVDAILNGIAQKTGTWDGQHSTKTTWANFPNAIAP